MRARPTRRRGVVAIAGALAALLALTGCALDAHVEVDVPPQVDAPFPDDVGQQLEGAVTSAMAATGSSGAIVGVWAPWSGTLVTGLGTESFADSTPISSDMAFRAGRLTRPMICDVLFEMAAAGTVKLDDPVAKWVSGSPDLTDVTLLQLCESTSGIGTYADQLTGQWLSNPTRAWNPRELSSYGLGRPRAADPGASYRDSDTGYVLLGVALERASGSSAASLLQAHVFDPLDLESTRLPARSAAASDDGTVLKGHQSQRDAAGAVNCAEPLDVTPLSASTGFTDSGVVSTIEDLGRYAQALATGSLVADDAKRFDTPLPIDPAGPSWFTTSGGAVLAGSLVGQFGSVPGYATAAFSDPESGLTVAVVLNNSAAGGSPAAYLAWELAAIASKAPATDAGPAPEAGLPWTAQQYHDQIAAGAICAPPAQ